MKNFKLSKVYIRIVFIVCIAYLILSYVAFMRSAVITANETTHLWRSLSDLLAFPMVQILDALGVGGSEIIAILLVNGFIWGVVVALVIYFTLRLFAK
jgi:hypothetical protein